VQTIAPRSWDVLTRAWTTSATLMNFAVNSRRIWP
jgi:hypothetical protein